MCVRRHPWTQTALFLYARLLLREVFSADGQTVGEVALARTGGAGDEDGVVLANRRA
jgi:hypothetical protein